jgi:predicted nucleic acid-binding protein
MNMILDTNVISELEGRKHSAHLFHWLNSFERNELFLTTVSVAEIRFGLNLLPHGQRRDELETSYSRIEEGFLGRILSFSTDAARKYGQLKAVRQMQGRPIETKDAMIAAICLSHGATLATRNVNDFEGLDLRLVNPFEGA